MSDWELYEPEQDGQQQYELAGSSLAQQHPILSMLGEQLAKHPTLQSLVGAAAKPAGQFAEAVESARLPSLAGGLLQGAGNTALSLLNIPADVLGGEPLPYLNLKKDLPQDMLSNLAFLGGEVGPTAVGAGGLYKLLGKIPTAAKGLGRIGTEALKGSAVGAGIGGGEEPYGREIGAALGGALPVGASLLSSQIAKAVSQGGQKAKNLYNKLYQAHFEKAAEKGITDVAKPEAKYELIKDHAPKRYTEALEDFIKNPSYENAHNAKIDLGKYLRKYDDPYKKIGLSSSEKKALKETSKVYEGLTNEISNATKNDQELAGEYSRLTQGYKEDVVPYNVKQLGAYQTGEASPNALVNALRRNEKFMARLGKQYPELKARNLLANQLLQKALVGGAGGIGGVYGARKLDLI